MFRKHILSDLRPYSCISPGCARFDQLFETREEWISHEQSHHCEWHCNAAHDEPSIEVFVSAENFKDHLVRKHSDSITDSQIPFLIDTQKRPSLFPFRHCPFCN